MEVSDIGCRVSKREREREWVYMWALIDGLTLLICLFFSSIAWTNSSRSALSFWEPVRVAPASASCFFRSLSRRKLKPSRPIARCLYSLSLLTMSRRQPANAPELTARALPQQSCAGVQQPSPFLSCVIAEAMLALCGAPASYDMGFPILYIIYIRWGSHTRGAAGASFLAILLRFTLYPCVCAFDREVNKLSQPAAYLCASLEGGDEMANRLYICGSRTLAD